MKPLLILFALATCLAAARKPNVVILLIDDLGYADIAPFGATKQKTPHLYHLGEDIGNDGCRDRRQESSHLPPLRRS